MRVRLPQNAAFSGIHRVAPHREILFPGDLDLLSSLTYSRGNAPKLAVAVAPARCGRGGAYSRGDIGDFQKSITACLSYRLRFRLVGSLARGGQNVERVSACLRRRDSPPHHADSRLKRPFQVHNGGDELKPVLILAGRVRSQPTQASPSR